MLSRLREHLGGAGLVVAIVALSVALAGGAIAANGGAGNGKATASAKAKKGPRGPKGPKGDTGPAGPAGPAGPQGAKGDTGVAGVNGSNGADGAKGATGNQGNQGAKGATGATGVTGPTGQTGYTKTLPPGETETGTWGFNKGETPEGAVAPIAFSIPLPGNLAAGAVHLIAPTGEEIVYNETTLESEEVPPSTDCAGTVEAPSAAPGTLCVYATVTPAVGPTIMGSNLIISPASDCEAFGCLIEFSGPGGGASAVGALLLVNSGTQVRAWGTWAVTAPLP
jgi:hypothetical protein